jgi:oligopeptide transport system substrate-binding protein
MHGRRGLLFLPWRTMLVLVLLVAAIVGLVRLSPSPPAADLRVVDAVSIGTLDPAQMSWLQDIRVGIQLYEGLYTQDETDGVAEADSPSADASGTRRTFRLRGDARWSNGDRVVAEDFAFAWRRALEPGTARDYAFFLDEIRGVAGYVAWRQREIDRLSRLPDPERAAAGAEHWRKADRRFANDVGIECVDDQTLRVELSRPVAYLKELLAMPVFMPLHRASVRRFERRTDTGLVFYDPAWCKPGNTFYNGAYVLADWQFKRGLLLTKNPYYRRADDVRVARVEWLDVSSVDTAWLMYETGRVDWLLSLEAGFAPELVLRSASRELGALNRHSGPRDDIHAFPAFGTYFYNFNCQSRLPDGSPNPLADARVRRAFCMAVNRDDLCRAVTRRDEPLATGLIPPGTIEGYPAVAGLGTDIAAARRLLAEAGWPDGRGFPETTILFSNEANHGLIAQSVAAMLTAQLGVRVRLVGKEAQAYRDDKKQHRFMIARGSWYGDYDDPTSFLDVFRAGNGNNDSDLRDPAYDAMLARADAVADPVARLNALAVPVLPLFHYVNIYAYNPRVVQGVRLSPRLLPLLRAIRVERGIDSGAIRAH